MPSPEMPASDTKVCPYCAEVIKAAAIKCRFCQSDLTGTAPSLTKAPVQATVEPSSPPVADRPRPAPVRTLPTRQEPDASPTASTAPDGPDVTGPKVVQDLEEPPAAPRRRLWGILLTALAQVLVVVFLVLAFREWQAAQEIEESEAAGRTVRASVTEKVEALLSYEHSTFDEDLEAAQEGMTPDFQEEYEPTVAEIRDRAIAQKRSQEADVVAVSVVSESPDEVVTLVFVNTLSSREGAQRQRLMQNRVTVTMVKQDGSWLIDELSVPQS